MLQLRTSIFPNIPPFINFIKLKEQYDSSIKLDIPWNLWINCNNPLLLHTFIRAGFVRTQVNQVKVVLEKLDSNQTWIGTGNSINLSLEIFSFLSENDHLRSLEKFSSFRFLSNPMKIQLEQSGIQLTAKQGKSLCSY